MRGEIPGAGAERVLAWVNEREAMVLTGEVCRETDICSSGWCAGGRCLTHSDPEVVATQLGAMLDERADAFPYLVANYVQTVLDPEGRSCSSDTDCGVPTYRCVNRTCHDEARLCRRRHVIWISNFVERPDPHFKPLTWANDMRHGGPCRSDTDCRNGAVCWQGTDELCKWKEYGFCVDRCVVESDGCESLVDEALFLLSCDYHGWPESPDAEGVRVDAMSHSVLVTSPPAWICGRDCSLPVPLLARATALAGGGVSVVPCPPAGTIGWYEGSEYYGNCDWQSQIDDLESFIRSDVESHICN